MILNKDMNEIDFLEIDIRESGQIFQKPFKELSCVEVAELLSFEDIDEFEQFVCFMNVVLQNAKEDLEERKSVNYEIPTD